MQIKNFKVVIQKDGTVWSTHNSDSTKTKWEIITNPVAIGQFKELARAFRSKRYTETQKDIKFENAMRIIRQVEATNTESFELTEELLDKSKSTMQKIIAFFSEFQFEPNFRFVNTMCNYCIHDGAKQTKEYIANYFNLVDHQYANSIVEKMKSSEFSNILDDMQQIVCIKKINNRFKVYYGSQGTGKTTKAMLETKNLCMVCHSAMLPSDLMEDFKFEEGRPNFKPSALQIAMVKGQKIVLDEINLLPFESLRFLQSVLDGKTEFTYKGETIVIKDGFQIIGTMNLTVNGCTFSLPEPLVDRACELRKYTLTADALIGALI